MNQTEITPEFLEENNFLKFEFESNEISYTDYDLKIGNHTLTVTDLKTVSIDVSGSDVLDFPNCKSDADLHHLIKILTP